MLRVVTSFIFSLTLIGCSQSNFEGVTQSRPVNNFADAEVGSALTCVDPATKVYAGENQVFQWAPNLQGLTVTYLLSTTPSIVNRGTVTIQNGMKVLYTPPVDVLEPVRVKITGFPADENIQPGSCEFDLLPARTPIVCETPGLSLDFGNETVVSFLPESFENPAYRLQSVDGQPVEGVELIGEGRNARLIHNAELATNTVVQVIATGDADTYRQGICEVTLIAPEPPTQIVCESDPVTLRDGDSTVLQFGPSDILAEVGYQILRDGVVVNDEFDLVASGLQATLTMPNELTTSGDLEIRAIPLGENARDYVAGSCSVATKPLDPPVALTCDTDPIELRPGEEAVLTYGPAGLLDVLQFEAKQGDLTSELVSLTADGQSVLVRHTTGITEPQSLEVIASVLDPQDRRSYAPAACQVTLLPALPPTPVVCATPEVQRMSTGDTIRLSFTPSEPGLNFNFLAFDGENFYPNFEFSSNGSDVEVTFTGSVDAPKDVRIVAIPEQDGYLRGECAARVIPNPVALECAQTPEGLRAGQSGNVLFQSEDGLAHAELELGYRLTSNLDQAGSYMSLDGQHGVLYTAPASVPQRATIRIEAFSLSEDYPVVPGVCDFELTPDPLALSCDTLPQSLKSGESVDLNWSAQGFDVALNFEVQEQAQEDGRLGTFVADGMSGTYEAPDFIREARQVLITASTQDTVDGREVLPATCEVRLVEEDPIALLCEGDGIELAANETVEFQIQPSGLNLNLQSTLLNNAPGTVTDLPGMKVQYTAPADIAQGQDVVVQVDGGLQTQPAQCIVRLKSDDIPPPVCKDPVKDISLDHCPHSVGVVFDHVQHGMNTEYWVEVVGASASQVNAQNIRWQSASAAIYNPPKNWRGGDYTVRVHLRYQGHSEKATCELNFKRKKSGHHSSGHHRSGY